jgi:sulfide:quinone oxidoreductase
VAALEAVLALRDLAADRVEIELLSPSRDFVYRPFAVGEPYGAAHVHRYDLGRLAERCGVTFRPGGVVSVDGDARVAITRDGERVPYDYLLIAPGARMLWGVPGAATFWGVADEGGVGTVVRKLRAGLLRNVVFTMPGGASWALPMYELALLAGGVLARSGISDASLTVATPEDVPLEVFGRSVGEQMSALLEEHGVGVVAGVHPVEFDGTHLQVAPGEPIETEAVVSMPRLEGRRIDGVPHDSEGFVAVDAHCRVRGMESVFAVGDVIDFPVKQGGLATQQADTAAAAIAVELGSEVEAAPFEPVLRGVLWTGTEPLYLYGPLTGGQGEISTLTEQAPWPPDGTGKILGRRLTPFLAEVPDNADRTLGAGRSSAA